MTKTDFLSSDAASDKGCKASVSVYLALIFTLIFSLILVSLEAARASVLRAGASLALATGIESTMADFYRPLFEKYHIFALDASYGSNMYDADKLKAHITKYASCNLGNIDSFDLEEVTADSVTADGGNFFKNQAVDAEKTEIVEGVIETLGERFGALPQQNKTAQAMARKTDLEAEFAKLDIVTAKLMRDIDGVICNAAQAEGSGVSFTLGGSFVKKFFVGEVNPFSVGINNSLVYAGLCGKYVNPVIKAQSLSERAVHYAEKLRQYEVQTMVVESLSEKYQTAAEKVLSDDAGDEEYELLQAMGEELEAAIELQDELREESDKLKRLCVGGSVELCVLISATERNLNITYEDANLGIYLIPGLKSKVSNYESYIEAIEGEVPEDAREMLLEPVGLMEEYLGMGDRDIGTDFNLIASTAAEDAKLLKELNALSTATFVDTDSAGIFEWSTRLKNLSQGFKLFSYDGFTFDYGMVSSELSPEVELEEAKKEVMTSISKIWLQMVMPGDKELSFALLNNERRVIVNGQDDSSRSVVDLLGGIFDILIGGESAFSSMEAASGQEEFSKIVENGFTNIYDDVLYRLYLRDFFNNYLEEDNNNNTVLKYEQEYLLYGNNLDALNLSYAVGNIVLLRMVSAGTFVFCNKALCAQAEGTARILVGFTGLPFLVMLVKTLILLIVICQQAIVEAAAIMRGKRIGLLTDKSGFCVSIPEIMSFSTDVVKIKSENYPESSLGVKYGDYLFLLMLAKSNPTLSGRAMTLIQENLIYGFEDNFRMMNCVVGVNAKASAGYHAAYVPIASKLMGNMQMRGYEVSVEHHGAYCELR